MKKCDECAYFEKQGKTIVRAYSDGRPAETLLADYCSLHDWWIPEDSHYVCEEQITGEDLKVQIEESQLVEREEREWESWGYECHGDEKYHEELCGIRSDTKWGWI